MLSMEPGAAAVAAVGLWKSFGENQAVRDLSFEAYPGEVMGLLGPNGAGKTTTIKMLTTLLPLDGGSALVNGFDVASRPTAVRRSIGLAGQAAAVDEKLTARENLELFGRLYKFRKSVRRRRTEDLIERFDLGEFADRTVDTYSGGERRRLDVVASLIAAPPVLFLDEPTTGLDPHSRSELWVEIRALADEGTAVVLTTQYLDEADRLSDRIVIIDEGQIKASGTTRELKDKLERDVLVVSVSTVEGLRAAVALVGDDATASDDPEDLSVVISVSDGPGRSLEVLRLLDDSQIGIEDFQLRKPTLDDVFLELTRAGGST